MADSENAEQARGTSRTPVAVFTVDSGGCGACVQSILALQSSRHAHALQAARVSFAQTPRHADVILISGPLTKGARESIARVINATPQQRALIAVGDCAIDGCVFPNSPALGESAATVFDVHVEIEGCPPAPLAILAAVGTARELLATAEEEGVIEDTSEEETTPETNAQDGASEGSAEE
jgi:Ni,Fe-hydrogenase III small subunit